MAEDELKQIVRTEEQQKRADEIHDSLRDELLKRELSNSENYDKAILTLSAASLGLSLTAIRFVVPLEVAKHLWMIKAGWLLLLVTIIVSLSAFLMSNKAISAQLKNAEDYYLNGIAQAFNRPNLFTKINNVLNLITGTLFLLALLAIVLFVTLNIGQEIKPMSKDSGDSKSTTTHFQESASMPSLQRIPPSTEISKNSANIPTMQQAPGTQTTSQNTSQSGNSGGGSSSSSSSSGKSE